MIAKDLSSISYCDVYYTTVRYTHDGGVLEQEAQRSDCFKFRNSMMRGALEFSVLLICSMFGLVFRFSLLKTAVFRSWGLLRFAGCFLNLVFGLQFSSTMMAVFRILLSSVFYGFSGFAKETKLHPAVTLKPVSNSKGLYI